MSPDEQYLMQVSSWFSRYEALQTGHVSTVYTQVVHLGLHREHLLEPERKPAYGKHLLHGDE